MREMKYSGVEWIGDIPAEWSIIKFKYLHKGLNTGEAIGKEYWTEEETDMFFYTAGLVPIRTNYKDFPIWKYTGENDLLMARNGTPYVYFPVSDACYTDHIIRASMKADINRKYVYYSLSQSILSVVANTVSIATWSASLWNEQIIPFPSEKEQQAIADILDRKCTQIDALIANEEQQIAKLKAYKQSVITETVTKGLDPDVAMKDSGVEWIGEIPEHWKLIPLSSLSKSMRNGYVGPTKNIFCETGIKYIQSLHIKEGKIDFLKHEYYVSEEWADKHPKVYTGNLLIVQTGDIGQVGEVSEEYNGCNCHALIIVDVNNESILSKFLSYYLQSAVGKELLLATKTGALLPHLNSGRIGSTIICVPTMQEQELITKVLDKKVELINELILLKQQKIEKLQQYKKSLIYEYVTGKKEVI